MRIVVNIFAKEALKAKSLEEVIKEGGFEQAQLGENLNMVEHREITIKSLTTKSQ